MEDGVSTRRSFVTGLGAGVAALGIGATANAAEQQPQQSGGMSTFIPERHADDDWLDKIPGKHRMIIDAASPEPSLITEPVT